MRQKSLGNPGGDGSIINPSTNPLQKFWAITPLIQTNPSEEENRDIQINYCIHVTAVLLFIAAPATASGGNPVYLLTVLAAAGINKPQFISLFLSMEWLMEEKLELKSNEWLLHQANAPAHAGLSAKLFLLNLSERKPILPQLNRFRQKRKISKNLVPELLPAMAVPIVEERFRTVMNVVADSYVAAFVEKICAKRLPLDYDDIEYANPVLDGYNPSPVVVKDAPSQPPSSNVNICRCCGSRIEVA
ncbi:amino acid transporter [Trichonephila clavipes]|nr:amino acid transporter [Trichonephila clavipes]